VYRRLVPRHLRPAAQVRALVLRNLPQHTVASGMFMGVPYTQLTRQHSTYMCRLLGTYELEVREAIDDLSVRPIDKVINVGAAEGYYVAGMARRLPNARIDAYEMQSHDLLTDTIAINQLQARVTLYGKCDRTMLNRSLESARTPLVIMDVEGAERDLLDPAACPRLQNAFILVELHEFLDAPIRDVIWDRFQTTHTIREFSARPRTMEDFPASLRDVTKLIPQSYLLALIREPRPDGMRWHYMIPRAQASG
jgi:hypothetical protein